MQVKCDKKISKNDLSAIIQLKRIQLPKNKMYFSSYGGSWLPILFKFMSHSYRHTNCHSM